VSKPLAAAAASSWPSGSTCTSRSCPNWTRGESSPSRCCLRHWLFDTLGRACSRTRKASAENSGTFGYLVY